MGPLPQHALRIPVASAAAVRIVSQARHPSERVVVVQFCARGSMFDVLAKARSSPLLAQQLDWPKRLSMALDAAKVWLLM